MKPAIVISAHLHRPCALVHKGPPSANFSKPTGVCVCVCVCASLFSCMCSLTFSAFVCTRTRKRAFAHKHGQTHKEVAEVTIPTMAWRMRPDAGYAVAQVCDNTNRHTNRHTDTQTPDAQVCVSLPSARFPVGVFLLPVTVLGCVLLLV